MTGNLENSYLGNIIGVQRQKMKDFTNSGLKKVKQMNQRATQGSKQLQTRRKQQYTRKIKTFIMEVNKPR